MIISSECIFSCAVQWPANNGFDEQAERNCPGSHPALGPSSRNTASKWWGPDANAREALISERCKLTFYSCKVNKTADSEHVNGVGGERCNIGGTITDIWQKIKCCSFHFQKSNLFRALHYTWGGDRTGARAIQWEQTPKSSSILWTLALFEITFSFKLLKYPYFYGWSMYKGKTLLQPISNL